MPSFTNTLGACSRRSQWRFRQVLRNRDSLGRLDTTDTGLIDFTDCSEVSLAVTPRAPHFHCWDGWWLGECALPPPVLAASMTTGTLTVPGPGLIEAVFPAGSLLAFPPGFYDVRIAVTVGPETEEIFCEPVEFV